MTQPLNSKPTANPYATGGGGVDLEHLFGATLLEALLTGSPVRPLGPEFSVREVHFQAGPTSPVDDFVLLGESPATGERRKLSVGVRRAPTLAPSDGKFVKLFADYLRIVLDHGDDLAADRWRLALAVSGPHTGASETEELASFARTHHSFPSFREIIQRDRSVRQKVRDRLEHLKGTTVAALTLLSQPTDDADNLLWICLRSLFVVQLDLDNSEPKERYESTARLRSVLQNPEAAPEAFLVLAQVASQYPKRAGTIDLPSLRRELHGKIRLTNQPDYRDAFLVLQVYEGELFTRVNTTLSSQGSPSLTPFKVARTAERDGLVGVLKSAAKERSCVLVTGEPDVGKSSLALDCLELIRASDICVVALHLRDLPASPIALRQQLSHRLYEVLLGLPTSVGQLLLIDGAEAVLEGWAGILRHVLTEAASAQFGTALVARNDASPSLAELVSACPQRQAVPHTVPPLTKVQTNDVANAFPSLRSLSWDSRSEWLLSRLGLVDVILRCNAVDSRPDGVFSEAGVYSAVWSSLIRRNEVSAPGGATPDGRDSAMQALAGKLIGVSPNFTVHDPHALSSLRSDGLLLSRSGKGLVSTDEFATDLVRDFATVRFMYQAAPGHPIEQIAHHRWTLRAARIYCECQFLSDRSLVLDTWKNLQYVFDNVARELGARWSEIPTEALIRTLRPDSGTSDLLSIMLTDDGRQIQRFCQTILNRFEGDTYIYITPVVESICDGIDRIEALRLPREGLDKIISRWLAGLIDNAGDKHSCRTRVKVRDKYMRALRWGHRGEMWYEHCALLGPDLSDEYEQVLRSTAQTRPEALQPCIENWNCAESLAQHNLNLLTFLTCSYFIIEPDNDNDNDTLAGRLDDGVRDHQWYGLGQPEAAWYYGPFSQVIHQDPIWGILVINTILNHAARCRVRPLPDGFWAAALPDVPWSTPEEPTGIELKLPQTSTSWFVGDTSVWCWYRSYGPNPCRSGLLAARHLADILLTKYKWPVSRILEALLRGCENMAMLALAVDFMIDNLELAEECLDPFLRHPRVWKLESSRGMEFGPLVSDNKARRKSYTLQDLSVHMVGAALHAQNFDRLARLQMLGNNLVEAATAMYGDSDEGESDINEITTAHNWAAALNFRNFRFSKQGEADCIAFQAPDGLALGIEQSDIDSGLFASNLFHKYTINRAAGWENNISIDVGIARAFELDPPKIPLVSTEQVLVVVARHAIEARARGAVLSDKDLRWSIRILLSSAQESIREGERSERFAWDGLTRYCAEGLGYILALACSELLTRDEIRAALTIIQEIYVGETTETQVVLGQSLECFWSAACYPFDEECLHRRVLEVLREGTRWVSYGPGPAKGWFRKVQRIEVEDPIPAILEIDALKCCTPRLIPLIVSLHGCATIRCCMSGDGLLLRDALLVAHSRAAAKWCSASDHRQKKAMVRLGVILLELPETQVLEHVNGMRAVPAALEMLLESLMQAATMSQQHRALLRRIWPSIMEFMIGEFEAGFTWKDKDYFSQRAIASLIPRPHAPMTGCDMDEAQRRAADGWPRLSELSELIERWLPFAAGSKEGLSDLVCFMITDTEEQQVEVGIQWVEGLVQGHFEELAKHALFFVRDWLRAMKKSSLLRAKHIKALDRIIDGLAHAGDWQALQMQGADEQ